MVKSMAESTPESSFSERSPSERSPIGVTNQEIT